MVFFKYNILDFTHKQNMNLRYHYVHLKIPLQICKIFNYLFLEKQRTFYKIESTNLYIDGNLF